MALMVICFAEAGSRVAATGGPYAYVEVALGPFAGFLSGALLLLTDLASAAAVSTVFAGSAVRLAGTTSSLLQAVVVVVVLGVVSAINVAGVHKGAKLSEWAVIAKLVPLVAFVALGAAFVHPQNWAWTATPRASNVFNTAGLVVLAFLGIEGGLQPSGEVRNPARTVPIAAILALGAATGLYLAVQLIAQGLLGSDLPADRVAPLGAAAASFAGSAGRMVMLAAATVSTFGFLTGSLLGGPRLLFALGRDGFGPRQLASVHRVYHTPHVAIAVYACITLLLALSGTFEQLAILANVSALLLYIACAIAASVLRRRDVRTDGEPFRAPGGALVPTLACVAIVWVLLETVTQRELLAVGLVLLIATIVYVVRETS